MSLKAPISWNQAGGDSQVWKEISTSQFLEMFSEEIDHHNNTEAFQGQSVYGSVEHRLSRKRAVTLRISLWRSKKSFS